jgi:hypothetical protein
VELRHRFRLVVVTSLKHQHPSQQQNTTVTICSVSLEPSPLTRYTLVRYPYPPLYNFLSPCQFLRIIIHSRKSLVCFCTSAMEEHIHVRSGLFSGRRPCSFVIKISFVPSLQHHRVSRSISSDEDARLNSARSPFHWRPKLLSSLDQSQRFCTKISSAPHCGSPSIVKVLQHMKVRQSSHDGLILSCNL